MTMFRVFFARCVFILFSVCPSTLPNVFVPSLICLDRNRHSFLLKQLSKIALHSPGLKYTYTLGEYFSEYCICKHNLHRFTLSHLRYNANVDAHEDE